MFEIIFRGFFFLLLLQALVERIVGIGRIECKACDNLKALFKYGLTVNKLTVYVQHYRTEYV